MGRGLHRPEWSKERTTWKKKGDEPGGKIRVPIISKKTTFGGTKQKKKNKKARKTKHITVLREQKLTRTEEKEGENQFCQSNAST